MNCCSERARLPTKTVMLIFEREQLLYDISNYAFVEGDIVPTEDEHVRHQVIDVTQEGNVDIVTRILDLAHTEVIEFLYPYTKEKVVDGEVLIDVLEETEAYSIELRVPDGFSRTTAVHLRELVHEYIVCRVLFEWLSITNIMNPRSREIWQEKVESAKTKIRSALLWRGKRIRLRQSPF